MSTFLFELGVEELPPAYVNYFAEHFANQFLVVLKENNINKSNDQISLYVAPRRIGLSVALSSENELEDIQADPKKGERVENGVIISKRFGPKVQALTDKPAVGFAKSCSVAPEELSQDENGRVFCEVKIEPKPIIKKLSHLIQKNFEQINKQVGMRFMHWADRNELFIRPVQWLLCMIDDKVIEMEWLGLKASNKTRGHRFHGQENVEIPHADKYQDIMQSQKVVASFAERKESIRKQLSDLAESNSASIVLEEDLLDEVTAINEWPVAVLCDFDKSFLEVPQEALIESMQSHQKSFALKDKAGKLLPHFITVANIESTNPESLKRGNEKVMAARLSDAKFFYDTDLKQDLESYIEKNQQVTFQKKLGSVNGKTIRVQSVAEYIADQVGANTETVNRAGGYINADLRSSMVYEFPELQGIMGKYYLLKKGFSQAEADCIEQRYWPRFAEDNVPATKEAACIALADRIDTLIGIFGINMKPTGSKDPYSLRRAAIGVVRIIHECKLEISLEDIMQFALDKYEGVKFELEPIKDVKQFIINRLEDIYDKNYPNDDRAQKILRAVLACQNDNLLDVDERFKALMTFSDMPELTVLAEANKRVKNLLQKVDTEIPTINKELLQEEAEIALAKQYEQIASSVADEKNYVNQFKQLSEFAKPLTIFFEKVMVMVDDEALKLNRLALLKKINHLFLKLADISYLS